MTGGAVDRRSTRRSLKEWLAFLPALLFAVYPLSIVLASNIGVLPISLLITARIAVCALGATALLWWPFRAVSTDRLAAGMWLGAFLLPLVTYGQVVAVGGSVIGRLNPEDWRFAFAYTVISLSIATAVVRPWQARRRDPVPLGIVAAVMLTVNIVVTIARASSAKEASWRGPADALTESISASVSGSPHAAARDIFYIVLDGMGRPDVLREYYGLDLDSFVDFLRNKGFYVAEQAHSNYSQTFLSIASTLNMDYLDNFAAAVGPASSNRLPLSHLIRFNAFMKLAHEVGYEVVGIASDYPATMSYDRADSCMCEQHGLNDLEQAALGATPLAGLRLGGWTHDAHRRKVLESFEGLEQLQTADRRTLIFAHIIVPHPPFLFGADGSWRQPDTTLFGFQDGNHFRGSRDDYIHGYREQTQFVAQRLRALVENLLSRPGPTPVIVFHGDHGPGSMLQWEDPQATNMAERMGIFAAYYFPDDGPELYPTMSPVNGARALASRYLGVHLPFLPDRSSFSKWSRPYDFVPVPVGAAAVPPRSRSSAAGGRRPRFRRPRH